MSRNKPEHNHYHHGNLKQVLLDNALDSIRTEPCSALSLRKLAARIGVNQTALYSHFKNKNDLLAELAATGFRQLVSESQALLQADTDPEQTLFEFAQAYLNFALQNPELFKLMFSPSFSELHQDNSALWEISEKSFHLYETLIAHYLRHKNSETNLKLASLAVWSFMHGFCHIVIGDRLSRETLSELENGALLANLLNIIKNGLNQ